MTVRAMAPSSSLALVAGMWAEVSPAASRVIACARPLSGRVMLRPISQLNASPISTAPQPTRIDDPARLRLRPGERRGGGVGAVLRGREDRVRLRNELLAGVGDLLERPLDVLVVAVPLRQRRRVVLHAPRQLLLQFGLRRQAAQDRLEFAEFLEEQFPGGARLVEPVLRFLAAHGEQRQQQLLAIGLGDPGHAVVDGLLDAGGGFVEPLAGALVLGEAELGLLVGEIAERRA